MEVGLAPGFIVLDGTHFPHKRDTAAPTFIPLYLLLPNGWMDQIATEEGLGPVDIVLDWDPALPMVRGTAAPTTFRIMSRHPTTQHVSSCLFLVFFIT